MWKKFKDETESEENKIEITEKSALKGYPKECDFDWRNVNRRNVVKPIFIQFLKEQKNKIR